MCLDIVACCFPPLAVCFKRGCGFQLCLSILLSAFFYIPGICHACYIINQEKKPRVVVVNQQTTHVQTAQPVAAQPAHITVNVPQQYMQPQPPINGQQYGPPMMNPYYPSPPAGSNVPPPYSSAPPYYGEGDKNKY